MGLLLALLVAAQAEAPAPPAAPPAADAKPIRVAVYELQAVGIEPRVARLTTVSLVAELRKLRGLTVIGLDEVQAMLDYEAQKQLQACDSNSCLAEIADSLGADTVIVGGLAKVGEEHLFSLRRVEQKTAQVNGQVNQRVAPAGGEEFLGVVGASVEALFPELPLKPGAVRGVAPEIAVRLNPPPLPPAPFFTAVGVTALGVVASSVVTGALLAQQAEFTQFRDGKSYALSEYEARAQPIAALQTATAISWSVTAAAAAATAGVWFFTDFSGAGDVRVEVAR